MLLDDGAEGDAACLPLAMDVGGEAEQLCCAFRLGGPQRGYLPEGHLVGGETGGEGVAAGLRMSLSPGIHLLVDDGGAGVKGGVVVLVVGDVEDYLLHSLGQVVLHQVHHLGLGEAGVLP